MSGNIMYSGTTGFNEMAIYTCDIGFTLNGISIRTCQDNGTWSGEEPMCTGKCSHYQHNHFNISIAANCGPPDYPSDTTALEVNFTSTAFGDIATYSCTTGYILNNNANRTCQSNSTWSGIAPSCDCKSFGIMTCM